MGTWGAVVVFCCVIAILWTVQLFSKCLTMLSHCCIPGRIRHQGGGYSALINNTNNSTPTDGNAASPAAGLNADGVLMGDDDADAMYYDGIDDDLLPLEAPQPVAYGHAKTFRAALVVS